METYSPFKLDDFWNDCINKPQSVEKNKPKKPSNTYRNNNNIFSLKTNARIINKSTKEYFSSVEKIYQKLNKKYPDLFEDKKINKDINKKSKINPYLKSQSLYEDAKYKKILIKKNMEENQKKQIEEELSLCTFRPKISKRKNEDEYVEPFYKRLYERDLKKMEKNKINNTIESNGNNKTLYNEISGKKKKLEKIKEYSNKPKKKMNKSDFLYKEKENAEFILRYTRARDERMIKNIKQLYKKDDSYDYLLNSLTSRIGNREYKNTLNVNNVVPLYGETVTRNDFIHSAISDFKGLSYHNGPLIKQSTKKRKQIMNIIRKGLLDYNNGSINNDL